MGLISCELTEQPNEAKRRKLDTANSFTPADDMYTTRKTVLVDPLSRLPTELIDMILSHFSGRDLWDMRHVSKPWRDLIEGNRMLWKDLNFSLFTVQEQQQIWSKLLDLSEGKALSIQLGTSGCATQYIRGQNHDRRCKSRIIETLDSSTFNEILSRAQKLRHLVVGGPFRTSPQGLGVWNTPASLTVLELHDADDIKWEHGIASLLRKMSNLQKFVWKNPAFRDDDEGLSIWRRCAKGSLLQLRELNLTCNSHPLDLPEVQLFANEDLALAAPNLQTLFMDGFMLPLANTGHEDAFAPFQNLKKLTLYMATYASDYEVQYLYLPIYLDAGMNINKRGMIFEAKGTSTRRFRGTRRVELERGEPAF